jgi:hypothetical protein
LLETLLGSFGPTLLIVDLLSGLPAVLLVVAEPAGC